MDPKPPTRLATTGYLVVTALLIVFLAAGVILAEVFAHGLRLREDVEGTI